MSEDILQIEYGSMEEIAVSFFTQAGVIDSLIQNLRFYLMNIEGDWTGLAAEKFFTEMESEIFPTLTRLSTALIAGGELTINIIEAFSLAEEEAATQFTFVDSNPINTSIPAHRDEDYGIPAPDKEVIPSHRDSDQKPASSKIFKDHSEVGDKDAHPVLGFKDFPICNEIDCSNVTLNGWGVSTKELSTFPIGPFRELLSMGLDITTLYMSMLELEVSLIGEAGQVPALAIGSLGGVPGAVFTILVERFGADAAETVLSMATASIDAFNDVIEGKTFIDPRTQELVIGQATLSSLAENQIDKIAPASTEVDIALNVAGLYGDVAGFFKEDSLQLRVGGIPPRAYFVHTEELQDPALSLIKEKMIEYKDVLPAILISVPVVPILPKP